MKFIIADSTEQRHLPDDMSECCTFVAGLEAKTGADFIITPLSVPVLEGTLPVHIAHSIGVQRKAAPDFLASFVDGDSRLWRQLVRMLNTWHPEQKRQPWLVTIGFFGQHTELDSAGIRTCYIRADEYKSNIRYKSFAGALVSWQLHGGYYTHIPADNLLLEWCEVMYARLVKFEKDGHWGTTLLRRGIVKPLELLTDVETTISTIPGIGVERAKAIYDETRKYIDHPTLIDCFRILKQNKIEGIGEKIKTTALKYVGWGNGEHK